MWRVHGSTWVAESVVAIVRAAGQLGIDFEHPDRAVTATPTPAVWSIRFSILPTMHQLWRCSGLAFFVNSVILLRYDVHFLFICVNNKNNHLL